MLNKQSQTADNAWSFFGVGRGANNPQRETQYLLRNATHSLGTRSLTETGCGGGGGVDWIRLAQNRDRWPAILNAVIKFRVLAPRS
jgi:hypothetical protein